MKKEHYAKFMDILVSIILFGIVFALVLKKFNSHGYAKIKENLLNFFNE